MNKGIQVPNKSDRRLVARLHAFDLAQRFFQPPLCAPLFAAQRFQVDVYNPLNMVPLVCDIQEPRSLETIANCVGEFA